MYYKHITVGNDDYRVTLQTVVLMTLAKANKTFIVQTSLTIVKIFCSTGYWTKFSLLQVTTWCAYVANDM